MIESASFTLYQYINLQQPFFESIYKKIHLYSTKSNDGRKIKIQYCAVAIKFEDTILL